MSFSFAQPVLPQRSLSVTATQGIHFGTFCVTGAADETVTVGHDGSRTASAGIALLTVAPTAHPAIFVIKLCEGRNVSVDLGAPVTLTNGSGGSVHLEFGPTDRGLNFITNSDCNFVTPLSIGGKLTILSSTTPGTYTGSFAITFNQQ